MKTLLSSLIIVLLTFSSGAQGIITTIAGGGTGGDGVLATSASLSKVNDILVDMNGNVYIAQDEAIRKIDAQSQIISLYAGSYQWGLGCDGCPATTGKLSHANAIAFDKQWNLYIADWGSGRIRKVDAVTLIMTTYAGTGTSGYSGDGGPATSARLKRPMDIAFDANDNLYIADEFYHIRRVDRQTGIITTIAGDGTLGSWNNGDLASAMRMGRVRGIAVDNTGNIFFADLDNHRIGRINTSGIVANYCGTGVIGNTGEGGPALNANIGAGTHVRLNDNGDLFFTDFSVVKKVDNTSKILTRIVGNGTYGFSGDGGPPLQARLASANSVCFDTGGNMFIADSYNYRIRKVVGITNVKHIETLDLGVFPNPSTGNLRIKANGLIKRLEIISMSGQTVFSANVNSESIQIDLSNKADGVYIVVVYGSESFTSKKLVLQRSVE